MPPLSLYFFKGQLSVKKYTLITYNCMDVVLFVFSVIIYLFKFNNRNTWKSCEICLKLTIITTERRDWRRSGVFIANFEHIHTFFWCFCCWLLISKCCWVSCWIWTNVCTQDWKKISVFSIELYSKLSGSWQWH